MAQPGSIVVQVKDGSKLRIYEADFNPAVHRRVSKAKPSPDSKEN